MSADLDSPASVRPAEAIAQDMLTAAQPHKAPDTPLVSPAQAEGRSHRSASAGAATGVSPRRSSRSAKNARQAVSRGDGEAVPRAKPRGKRRAAPAATVQAVASAQDEDGAQISFSVASATGLEASESLPPSSSDSSQEQSPSLPESMSTAESIPGNGQDESGEPLRRKSRRGRRGGRGRKRKTQATCATPTTQIAPEEEDAEEAQTEPEEQDSDRTGLRSKKPESARAKRRMFISVLPGEEVEVALTEDGHVLEYYLDMLHQCKLKGNIYKGVIHNIDTNLQAAFVSYGTGKNGFLQIDEVHPEYWLVHHEPSKGKRFPPIQKALKPGQEILVQVVKEPMGNKGAFLTTWLSLAGRFLVLTPGQEQIGVSRKVEDEAERTRLREMMNGIDPGQGLGVIVRTVSAGTTKTTLKNDLQYLKRVWRDIRKKGTEITAPGLIYQEPSLSERAVRDYLTEDVTEIWVDNEDTAQSIRETVALLFPRKKDLVRMHVDGRTSMWERFNLRRQLEQIYAREVLLPSGGRLVFDQTEALMAIDINSGKISGKANFEAMAHKTNMEAAEAIARHLRLRDIGGQVVIDFIEMRDKSHVEEVEKTLRNAMKNDRARHDVGHMSSFGLLELVRQRTGSSALANSLEPCPACRGTGVRRNIEWQALQALRDVRRLMSVETRETCVYSTESELALYLLNHKRDSLREIERNYGKCLEIVVRP